MKSPVRYLKLALVFSISLSCMHAIAQQPKKKNFTPVQKFKPPVTKSWLGRFSGNKSTCSVDEGKKLVALPLKITDAKNTAYTVYSYQFAYKRIGVTEDEETGKVSPQSDMVSDRFSSTPLPKNWQDAVTEGLHKGEELYFFDIIVTDKQGRKFFAPELKITME